MAFNVYQRQVYNVAEKMDVFTLTCFLNSTNKGVDWTGCTKKDMLECISDGHHRLDKLTEAHVRIAVLLLDEERERKEDIRRARKQFRDSVRAKAKHIGRITSNKEID